MPRSSLQFSAAFEPRKAVLYVFSRRGALRLYALPLGAERLAVDRYPEGWAACQPKIRVDRLLRLARHADESPACGFVGRSGRLSRRDGQTSCAVAAFISAVGETLCRTVAQFRACREQFAMLGRLQAASEILRFRANPALVYAALDEAGRSGYCPSEAVGLRSMATRSARRLARDVGFPNDRFLRRVAAEDLSPRRLEMLRDLCRQSRQRRVLSHLARISGDVIELMSRSEVAEALDNRLWTQLGQESSGSPLPTAAEIAALVRFLRQASDRPVRIRSVEHFWHLRERNPAIQYVAPDDLARLTMMHFASPPIPDEPGFIDALRTGRQLIAESVKMHHCVAGQFERVLRGEAYYYHIEGWGMPRGTMEICFDGEIWRIAQIVGTGNQRFPSEYLRHAAIWLADRQRINDETLCCPAGREEW